MKSQRPDNKRHRNEGKSWGLLLFISIAICFVVGCSNNSGKSLTNTDQKQQEDTLAKQPLPAPSEAPLHAEPSIFDRLANDMVYVEGDTMNFYICKYEVTQRLWTEVMGNNPSEMQGDDLPVEQVNWNDCQTFIGKLNELTGKKYRLPTETEWEYACRGGKLSKGYAYSGSDDIREVAWYDENSEGKTHPVGQKLPNELGLYDMSGNVWEWCQDMHDLTGNCRGGSWIHNARNCDPSLRNETPRAFWINSLGLRLAI